ncbi:hypothetical protein [Candidatus Leptofilum sp.]|uniref:hypothetical protein n=1 Tax=Candidatus Leptofilum sp. TaxID=3241576 RepID=UPI003B58DAA6
MNYFLWGAIVIFSVAFIEIFLNRLVDDLIPPATTKWVRILYLGIIVVLVLIALSATIRGGETAPEEQGLITHQIRVLTADEAPIVGASVALDVSGSTPILATSDTAGVAVLQVPEAYLGETAVLNVSAPGFEGHRQFVTIRQSQMPPLIILQSE